MADDEHDATILVDLQLKGFTFLEVRPGFIRFAAIIGPDPRAWPAGSGPETVSTCTDKMCRGDHPIGPYMPPEVLEVNKLAGMEVLVDVLRA